MYAQKHTCFKRRLSLHLKNTSYIHTHKHTHKHTHTHTQTHTCFKRRLSLHLSTSTSFDCVASSSSTGLVYIKKKLKN
jgi:arginine/lysine/ornithine decarboxylase